MKVELYILCGIQFSGKTYLAKHIQERNNLAIISFDQIYADNQIFFDKSRLKMADRWTKVKSIALTRLKRELKNGHSVVWDSTNPKKIYRDELREIARQEGTTSKLIFVNTPMDIIYLRFKSIRKSANRYMVSKGDLERTVKEMEPPGNEEKPYVLKPGDNIAAFIDNLLR